MARQAWGPDNYTGVAIAFMAQGDGTRAVNIVLEAQGRFANAETRLLMDLVYTWVRLVTDEADSP